MNTAFLPTSSGIESLSANQPRYLTPSQREILQNSLQEEQKPEYRRRIEIMLLADAGHSQSQICSQLGCSQETARYWITMARTGQAHTWQHHPIGRPKTVSNSYLDRLKELVHLSPKDCGYPFKVWTAQRLSQHLAKEFGIDITDRHINRLLKKMGLSTNRNHPTGMSQPDDSQSHRMMDNLLTHCPTFNHRPIVDA